MPRSQAAGDVFENPDPVLHEPEKPRVPGEPVAVRDATAQDDRAQRKHDQTHVVAAPDPESHTQGHRRAAHVPRAADRHGRVYRDAHQARRRIGQRAGETLAQPPGILAVTVENGSGTLLRMRARESRPTIVLLIQLLHVYNY